MDKIVIVAKNPEDVELLRACYKILFPDRELQIIVRPVESLKDPSCFRTPAESKNRIK